MEFLKLRMDGYGFLELYGDAGVHGAVLLVITAGFLWVTDEILMIKLGCCLKGFAVRRPLLPVQESCPDTKYTLFYKCNIPLVRSEVSCLTFVHYSFIKM